MEGLFIPQLPHPRQHGLHIAGLGNKAGRAQIHAVPHTGLIHQSCQHNAVAPKLRFLQFLQHAKPIQPGQNQFHQHHIGVRLFHQGNQVRSIGRFPNHLHILFFIDNILHQHPELFFRICKHNSDFAFCHSEFLQNLLSYVKAPFSLPLYHAMHIGLSLFYTPFCSISITK